MNKKADMPYWLVMTIIVLLGLVVMLIIVGAAGGKLGDFANWLADRF